MLLYSDISFDDHFGLVFSVEKFAVRDKFIT